MTGQNHGDRPPRDQTARDQTLHSLDENLFVEAGAGTGKTTALVGRMVALVVDEGVPVEEIAAITFTEKAAAELGDRFRRRLDEVARHDPDPGRRRRADDATADVDLAALTTLHGFARRLLTDHPLEAGLPPGFEVQDENASSVGFADRWADLQHHLLTDDGLARTILLADALGIHVTHLRDLARGLDNRWDLLHTRRQPRDPDPIDLDDLLDLMGQAIALDRQDLDGTDTLRVRIAKVRTAVESLEKAVDEADAVRLLREEWIGRSFNVGNSPGRKEVWGGLKTRICDLILEAGEKRRALLEAVADSVLRRLLDELARATRDAAADRRRTGTLTFHDLLVQARDVLADPDVGPTVRSNLHQRYGRLLLDEFQDTDPLQLEIALLLSDPVTPATEYRKGIDRFSPAPGSLFLVGDPKQSIYRFRRANISLYLEARRSLSMARPALTENFRTTVPIVEWINAAFGHLVKTDPRSTDLVQPDYVPLVGRRPAAPVGPAVAILGRAAHGENPDGTTPNASDLQELEAADVAEAITTAVADGWQVEGEGGSWRSCRFADIAILLPSKNSLPSLETALEGGGIPYRAESNSLLFTMPQVRDLLMVLRAVDDPTDDLAVVAALRTPYLGCGDDDLAHWRVDHGGSWNHQAPQPDGDPSVAVVAEGLAWLGEAHRLRQHLGPSGVLERLVRDRRVLQVAFGEQRPRDAWRRVRLLADKAREFVETDGGSLRDFIDRCLILADESSQVREAVLPETDDNAVRILTIHGAKGLEFPITILSGMTTEDAWTGRGTRFLTGDDGFLEARIQKGNPREIVGVETAGFEKADAVDQFFQDAETIRLLYVAATRARDHLLVSLHRAVDAVPLDRPGHGRLLARALAALDELGEPVGQVARGADLVPTTGDLPEPPDPSMRPLPDRPTWLADRQRVMDRAARPRTVSATAIATHAVGAPDEDRARPGEVGRHGTGVGRAVHSALEDLDFDATASTVATVVRDRTVAEGVAGDRRTVEALVRAGLACDSVRGAASARHWRELYVAAPVNDWPGAPVVEGYVDLAYLEVGSSAGPDGPGLVIVDYKTDAVADDAERQAKADRYRLQGATYALAAERATGLPVRRVILCFLAADGATEVEVDELPAAMAEVAAVARELSGRSTGT